MSGAPADRDGAPAALLRPYRLIAFDWNGTAVADPTANAATVRDAIERLLRRGVLVAVITGMDFDALDRQFAAAVRGPHKRRLFVLTGRGSEVRGFDEDSQPVLLWQRVATQDEERRLATAADTVRTALVARTGLDFRVKHERMNRRAIDLLPLPWRADPHGDPHAVPHATTIGALQRAVHSRLVGAGMPGGVREAFRLARRAALACGLDDARITSDYKHLEIGLTDKSASVDWLMHELAPRHGIAPRDVLIVGDEFGPTAGLEGSDARLRTESARDATFVSVGPEADGVPPRVHHVGGGPERFIELLVAQAALHARRKRAAAGRGPGPHAVPNDRAPDPTPAGTSRRPAGRAVNGGAEPRRSTPAAAPADPDPGTLLPVQRTDDPCWRLVEEGFNVSREHEIESLFAISNGYVGTRGSLAEGSPHSAPATFVAGVFDRSAGEDRAPRLAIAPDWLRLNGSVDGEPLGIGAGEILEHRRILDLRQGLLWRELRHRTPGGRITHLCAIRLASLADRHALVQIVALVPENFGGRIAVEFRIEPPTGGREFATEVASHPAPTAGPGPDGPPDASHLALRTRDGRTTIAFSATRQFHPPGTDVRSFPPAPETDRIADHTEVGIEIGRAYRVDRIVSVYTSRETADPTAAAARHLAELVDRGADRLVEEHVAAWRERWRTADVRVDGDDSAQHALRFACYHLIAAANPADEESSIGARALTGPAYSGHVFWDTEIYMLPFYVHTYPEAARALLMYRCRTLPAAREKARAAGFEGAFYPWESAHSGIEATPTRVLTPTGELLRIRNGEIETHISADVAYGVWRYWASTGDDAFLRDHGAEVLIETARFWASRGRLEPDGRFHIRGVIGPDEYHEEIDDDAYTNGMARWNLEIAADVARILAARWPDHWHALRDRLAIDDDEPRAWRRLADAMCLRTDPSTGVIEQFEGFFELEEIDLAAYEPRTAPMDVILGHERIRRTQIIKQPDVLLLIYLLWDRFPARVREANFRYYDPRTGHGSSLSPSIHALLAARLGRMDSATRYFRQAAEIDLANNMGNAAGGVHAAALGGLWQAAVFGFAGLQCGSHEPALEPNLPPGWNAIRFPFLWRGKLLHASVDAGGGELRRDADSPTEA